MSVSMINGHIDEVMSDEEIIAKKLDSLHEKILKSKFAETVYESEVMALILAVQTINRQKAEIDILIRKHDTLRDEIAEKDMEIERLRAEAYKEFAERLCEGRVSNDPIVIAVKVELNELTERERGGEK